MWGAGESVDRHTHFYAQRLRRSPSKESGLEMLSARHQHMGWVPWAVIAAFSERKKTWGVLKLQKIPLEAYLSKIWEDMLEMTGIHCPHLSWRTEQQSNGLKWEQGWIKVNSREMQEQFCNISEWQGRWGKLLHSHWLQGNLLCSRGWDWAPLPKVLWFIYPPRNVREAFGQVLSTWELLPPSVLNWK